jgi:predicted nucleic acid-binding Zn ribbon protein
MDRQVFDLTQKQIFIPRRLRMIPINHLTAMPITDFNVHTNGMMTGSAKNIRYEKKFVTHYIKPHLVCDCCGKKIQFKPMGSLCEKCDEALNHEFQQKEVRNRIFSRPQRNNRNLFLQRF